MTANNRYIISLMSIAENDIGDLVAKFFVNGRGDVIEINITDKIGISVPDHLEICTSDLERQLSEREYEITATDNLKRIVFMTDEIKYDIEDYIDSISAEYDTDDCYDEEERFEINLERMLKNL